METFEDLKTLFNHLEEAALDYNSDQIANLFQGVRDANKEINPKISEKSQWEVDFFSFQITEGRLKPIFSQPKDKVELVEYPSFKRFNNQVYEYLKSRLNDTSNSKLKARYAFILWHSPKKHFKYSKIATDSYFELLKIYEEQDRKNPQDHYGLKVLDTMLTIYSLCKQMKSKVDQAKKEILRLVHQFNFESSSSFALRTNLIELMLKGKKLFSKDDFRGVEDIYKEISDSLIKANNTLGAFYSLQTGLAISKKTETNTNLWIQQAAIFHEKLMKAAEKKKDSTFLIHCQNAIDEYKKIKDIKKVEELQKKYEETKNSIEYQKYEYEINIEDHIKECKKIASSVSQRKPDEIIKFLMNEKILLPTYKKMVEISEELNKKFAYQHLFSPKIIDHNGNIAQHFDSDEEIKNYQILKNYSHFIESNKIFLINEVFFTTIEKGKLSTRTLMIFFRDHSWFGKDLEKKMTNNETIAYNWLDLLSPSIHNYFIQMEYYFLNPENIPNFILCIDSLSLKIEGLLRDLCRFSGVSVSNLGKDHAGRNITQEKDIHALLYEKKIKELLNEDDLLLLRFLLVEKAGYNLRHEVAHALMIPQEYHYQLMHLLILALLKLGKYDFVKKDPAKSKDQ